MIQASKGFQAMRARMRGQQPDNGDGISTELGAYDTSTAMGDIQKFKQSHQFDPNLPQEHIDALRHAAESGDTKRPLHSSNNSSKIPRILKFVQPFESRTKSWLLTGSAHGYWDSSSLPSPAISFPSIVVQLLVYPIGCFCAKVVPRIEFNTLGLAGLLIRDLSQLRNTQLLLTLL
ncbi:hypothetical protein ACJ73_07321, partial [Blastomyces percursus]